MRTIRDSSACGGPTSRAPRRSKVATCCCWRRACVAVGVGERTTPAGAEALARSLFDDDLAANGAGGADRPGRAQMHLDTVCTMVDTDAVVMYPNIVDSLSAFTIRRTPDGVRIDR